LLQAGAAPGEQLRETHFRGQLPDFGLGERFLEEVPLVKLQASL
jgi:hypothetical protein